MKKIKPIVTKDEFELAEFLGLSKADALNIEFKSDLNTKIINIVDKLDLTHAGLAKLVGCPRSRITALLNRNTQSMSSDFMLKVLNSLCYAVKPTLKKIRKVSFA